jgi:hypothetical protein
VHATTEADQLSVVVLAGKLRGLDVPCQRTSRSLDLVRGDLLAVATAAQDDAQAASSSATTRRAVSMQKAG